MMSGDFTEPLRSDTKSRVRDVPGRQAIAPIAESRFQFMWSSMTGVQPRGAHEERTDGRWEKPLSSTNTTVPLRLRAPF